MQGEKEANISARDARMRMNYVSPYAHARPLTASKCITRDHNQHVLKFTFYVLSPFTSAAVRFRVADFLWLALFLLWISSLLVVRESANGTAEELSEQPIK